MVDLKAWWQHHNEELDKECKFSAGDRVTVTKDILEQMEYLPDVHAALRDGTGLGVIRNRTESRFNGGVEPRYEVILDDCKMGNVEYSESELTLEAPVELVALDNAIAVAESNLNALKIARNRIVMRLNK